MMRSGTPLYTAKLDELLVHGRWTDAKGICEELPLMPRGKLLNLARYLERAYEPSERLAQAIEHIRLVLESGKRRVIEYYAPYRGHDYDLMVADVNHFYRGRK